MRRMALAVVIFCAGCANQRSSHVMIGTALPPVDPSQVQVYMRPPHRYVEIALVAADSRGSFRWSSQGTTDAALERLKCEAARLGADGLLNLKIGEPWAVPATLGAGVAYGWGGFPAGYGLGTSVSVPSPTKSATALAVRIREK